MLRDTPAVKTKQKTLVWGRGPLPIDRVMLSFCLFLVGNQTFPLRQHSSQEASGVGA